MLLGISLLLLCLIPFIAVFGILSTIFWIWMLIDCLTKEPDQGSTKLVWAVVILFTHFIGALLYYFIRRPERKRLYSQQAMYMDQRNRF
jgi:Phospholipase_D-nuclease N-terminal